MAGRVTQFVRVGDTVRRPATESSASVRQLLVHLERAGFDGAPRFLGAESDGSIVLSWIDGWVPVDSEGWRLGLTELESVGELLRSYHDCVVGFAPQTGFEEGPQTVAADQVVCHGDIAPRNTVFGDGRATAFIDWDGIFVSTPMWDLAHAVWQLCDIADEYRITERYDSARASGCRHRRSGNRLKSESVVTNVQPCSTATAACWASATSFPVAPDWRHIL